MNTKTIAAIAIVAAVVVVGVGVALALGNNGDHPAPEPTKPGVTGTFQYDLKGSFDTTPADIKVTGVLKYALSNGSDALETYYSVKNLGAPTWFPTLFTSIYMGPAGSSGPSMYNSLLTGTIKVKPQTIEYEGKVINVDVYGKTVERSDVSLYYLYYVGANWHVYKIVESDSIDGKGFTVTYNLKPNP